VIGIALAPIKYSLLLLWQCLMARCWHLLGASDNCRLLVKASTLLRQSCNSKLSLLNSLASSAYKKILLHIPAKLQFFTKSFMYTLNKSDSSTLPWGTPLVTSRKKDFTLLMHKLCDLLLKNSWIQLTTIELTPYSGAGTILGQGRQDQRRQSLQFGPE